MDKIQSHTVVKIQEKSKIVSRGGKKQERVISHPPFNICAQFSTRMWFSLHLRQCVLGYEIWTSQQSRMVTASDLVEDIQRHHGHTGVAEAGLPRWAQIQWKTTSTLRRVIHGTPGVSYLSSPAGVHGVLRIGSWSSREETTSPDRFRIISIPQHPVATLQGCYVEVANSKERRQLLPLFAKNRNQNLEKWQMLNWS